MGEATAPEAPLVLKCDTTVGEKSLSARTAGGTVGRSSGRVPTALFARGVAMSIFDRRKRVSEDTSRRPFTYSLRSLFFLAPLCAILLWPGVSEVLKAYAFGAVLMVAGLIAIPSARRSHGALIGSVLAIVYGMLIIVVTWLFGLLFSGPWKVGL